MNKGAIISLVLLLIVIVFVAVLTLVYSKSSKEDVPEYLGHEFFQNSILRKVRNEKLSFESEIKVFDVTNENGKSKKELMNVIKDAYDFDSTAHKMFLEHYEDGEKVWENNLLTINGGYNNLNEIYEIDYDQRTCEAFELPETRSKFYFYLGNWMPKEVLDPQLKEPMLSPNYLLYYIFNEYRGYSVDVKCQKIKDAKTENKTKCQFTKDEKVKVEYFFENVGEKTMYPKSISIYVKKMSNNNWNHYREIEYAEFKAHLDGKQLVNENLPIGLLCERKDARKYGQRIGWLKTPFTDDYYFDYDLTIEKFEENKKIEYRKVTDLSIYSIFSKFGVQSRIKTYSAHGVNEKTNQRMITFYDKEMKLFYDYYPEKEGVNKCERQSYFNSKETNWFYFSDLFVQNVYTFDFLANTAKFSYLGRYKVDGKDSLVFEQHTVNLKKRLGQKSDETRKINSQRENLNKISAEQMTAIYYYHPQDYGFPSVQKLIMPFKMEFRLQNDQRKEEARLTLDVKNYYPQVLNHEKAFGGFENCFDIGDKLFIKFTGLKSILKKIKNKDDQIKQSLRESLKIFISPFRTNKFTVQIVEEEAEDMVSIYVWIKLNIPLESERHFNATKGEEFECFDQTLTFSDMDSEGCARECLGRENCGAWSFSGNTEVCKLCKIKSFNFYFGDQQKNFKYSNYFKTIKNENSILATKRALFYYSKHTSNKNLFAEILTRIKKGKLDLKLYDDQNEQHIFKAKAADI